MKSAQLHSINVAFWFVSAGTLHFLHQSADLETQDLDKSSQDMDLSTTQRSHGEFTTATTSDRQYNAPQHFKDVSMQDQGHTNKRVETKREREKERHNKRAQGRLRVTDTTRILGQVFFKGDGCRMLGTAESCLMNRPDKTHTDRFGTT